MGANNKHDDPLAGLVAHTLAQSPSAPHGDCPSADILAAYFDHSLRDAEAGRWEVHFSSCTRCQEQLAAIVRSQPQAASKPVPAHAPPWFLGWRWLAPAAAVLGVVTIWVVMRTDRSMPDRKARVLQTENRPGELPAAKTPGIAATERADEKTRKKTAVGSFDRKADARPRQSSGNELRDSNRAGAESVLASRPTALDGQKIAQVPSPSGPVKSQEKLAAAVGGQVSDKVEQSQSEKRRDEQVQLAQIPRDSTLQKLEPAPAAKESKQVADAKPAVTQEQSGAAALGRTVASRASGAEPRAPALREGDRANTQFGLATQGILILSPTKKTIWRLGPNGRIDRSNDAGNTWVAQESPVEVALLAGSASSDSVCWAVGPGAVVRTTNGETWEKLTPPVDQDITIVRAQDALRAVVGTPTGTLYSTTDGGRSWRKL